MNRSLLLMALVMVGCGGPLEASDDELGTVEGELGQTSEMRVRTTATQKPPKFTTKFVTNDTNTLFFAADLNAGAGPHTLAFEVYEPFGNLYQRHEVAFTGKGQVFDSMPCAGTWIQQFAMTGTWEVKVFVDGASSPSGSTTFSLR